MELLLFAMGWLPAAGALAALAASYAYARRRALYQPRDPSNERTDRVWHSASLFALAVVVPIVIALLILGVPYLIFLTLIAACIFGVVGLVLIIVIDLVVVKPLEAKRTRGWMTAAPFIFALVFFGFLLLPLFAWTGAAAADMLGLGPLSILGDAAAAGLVWWAYLPLDEAGLRRTFE